MSPAPNKPHQEGANLRLGPDRVVIPAEGGYRSEDHRRRVDHVGGDAGACPKTDEREILIDLFDTEPDLLTHPDGLVLVVDKGYRDRSTERQLTDRGVTMIRPSFKGEKPRPGRRLLRAVRQTIESVNQTLKGQLDLEEHGGRTPDGVVVRVLQRILALTAAIWHNWQTGQPAMRSLTGYDH